MECWRTWDFNLKKLAFPSDIIWLPEPHPSGIVGLEGSLNALNLEKAYRNGIFPWFSKGDPIYWYNPDPRFVLFLDEYRIPKGIKALKNSGKLVITVNKTFPKVIKVCKEIKRKDQEGTWITDEMEAAYLELEKQGKVLSIEVWEKENLVGGLYGVKIGRRFSGESMFTKVSNASKLAFDFLVEYLKEEKSEIIDCQIHSDHLERIGAREISRSDFLRIWGNLD